jgi:preprotein translocase subunit YajC
MDTILYIVIAIAIMAFQVYNEKKKKESQNTSPARRGMPQVQQDAESELSAFEKLFGLEIPDSARATVAQEILPDEFESEEVLNEGGGMGKPAKIEEKQTIQSVIDGQAKATKLAGDDLYSSSEISGDKFNNQEDEALAIKQEFNPKLFILYSEIAKPKFLD